MEECKTDTQPFQDPVPMKDVNWLEGLNKIFHSRKLILKWCGIAAVIGLIIGFSKPKEYVTAVQLAPEVTDLTQKSSLGGLAAIAGINLGNTSNGDAFSPDLYPDIVMSTPFILELFPLKVEDRAGDEYTLYDYLFEHQKENLIAVVLKSPFRFLKWIKGVLGFGREREEEEERNLDFYFFTRDEDQILQRLRDRIIVDIDKKTFVITIAVQMQDPLISAQVTQTVLDNLQAYMVTYRTRKAKKDLEFTEKVFGEARDRYFDIQRQYANFEDANRHISTATYRTEQERLKNEMTLAFNVYNSLSQQMEQDKLRVQENTPVFAVLEPVKVPLLHSSPKKAFIMIGFIFLGFILAVSYLLFKDNIKFYVSEIKKR